MRVEVLCLDGPAAGSGFETGAFEWPPPEEIWVVTGGKHGPELLDLLEDEPRAGEDLHLYRRAFHGFSCSRRKCRLSAGYELLRRGAPAQPALFEELPEGVADLRSVRP